MPSTAKVYKLLFLDIDGVMNHEHFYRNRSKEANTVPYPLSEFDPFCVRQLNRIIKETGALLVVSSSWRFDEGLQNTFNAVGIEAQIHGVTPHIGGAVRGREIKAYVDGFEASHDTAVNYCILDDDADMLPEQMNSFVRTNAYGRGLTKTLADKAIKILNKKDNMRVFTHFYRLSDKSSMRYRTLLQFGRSFKVIGSVVMKNPGSANFLNGEEKPVSDPFLLDNLKNFDAPFTKKNDWYEFGPDATMRCIAKLYEEYYKINGNKPLNGVIQIFNLLYFKDVNPQKALVRCRGVECVSMAAALSYDIDQLVSPIYLGFGNLATNRYCEEAARKYFDSAKSLGADYLDEHFESNEFMHPLYLMMYGKNKPECVRCRENFYNNSYNKE